MSLTRAPASETDPGSTVVASKVELLRIATGTTPAELRLIETGALAGGLISMLTVRMDEGVNASLVVRSGVTGPCPPTTYREPLITPAPAICLRVGVGAWVVQESVAGS